MSVVAAACLAAALGSRPSWAVVTGASSGIGRSIALEAAARGYNVVVAARRKDALTALVNEIKDIHGVEARAVVVDLANERGASRLHRATSTRRIAPIELVVANAGSSRVGELIKLSLIHI